ncbi:MAG: hypothetical protein EBU90_21645 [Proteobacteria bacterium]|nr:hypothetical protein [Pseudomonadota bacterium]
MSLVQHAERELELLGGQDDEMQSMMNKHILHMVKEFADEGHSGFSASYALFILTRLLDYKPIKPLTGEDDEWFDHGHTKQNKRCSSVFKDTDGNCYDINGRVFWEWYRDEETGQAVKTYYTSYESRLPVTFPYDVPDSPVYEYRKSDAEPPSPPQNENGLL